jgi:transcriptional regulator with XRE-family HTH domain
MEDWDRIVGESVRRLRLERGLTQEALAHEVGISTRYVGMLERAEKSATVRVLGRVASALGVTPSFLMERADSERS